MKHGSIWIRALCCIALRFSMTALQAGGIESNASTVRRALASLLYTPTSSSLDFFDWQALLSYIAPGGLIGQIGIDLLFTFIHDIII